MNAEKLALGLILTRLRSLGWEHYALDGWEFVGDKSIEQVVEDCAAVDDCGLRMLKDGGSLVAMLIVWGNSPSELIADHSCSHGFEEAMDAALKGIWPDWPNVAPHEETERYLRKGGENAHC